MNARVNIPPDIQHRVLDRSRRRCALCIHFNNDWGQKEGQIAHLDRDPSNFAEDNLAFLCLPHHDDYDTKRRQTKNLTIREAKTARDRLYAFIEGGGDVATAGRQDDSFAKGAAQSVLIDRNSSPPLEIIYPNIVNSGTKESLFRRSWLPLANGLPIQRHISFHTFFVGVRNNSAKTLRNVRLVLEDISNPGRTLNASCLCERTNRDIADIPPQGMDYFLIGEGTDGSDDGMFHPNIVSKDEYERILSESEAHNHIGFVIKPINGRYDLLRNDGYKMTITAYADDTLPEERQFFINTRSKVELILVNKVQPKETANKGSSQNLP